MALDPHAKKILDMLAAAGMSGVSGLTPVQLREGFHGLARTIDDRQAPIGSIEERALPGAAGPLRTRVYIPREPLRNPLPGIVYFHGGGGIFGSIDTHEGLCRMLASESGCEVLSIGYRPAPEHLFPAALDDCRAAVDWVLEHADELALDPDRIAVAGDSAGANLAAAVCQMAWHDGRTPFALQVLLCPILDLIADTNSRRAYAQGYFLSRVTMDWLVDLYCPPDIDRGDPRLSPLRAGDLSGLPPAHIHTAEFDPLRDEGEAYAKRLQQAGVVVEYTCHPGMIHHFLGMAGVLPYARTAMKMVGAAVKRALA